MAQTGFTPIQLYSSSTATNVPLAANLATGELAINITDGKLFYKDNAAAVQVIGWKTVPTSAGGTGLTSYTAGDTVYYATGAALSKLTIGATNSVMTSTGSAPQWSTALTLSGNVTAAAFIPSGATIPTNGLFLPAANSVGIAASSAEQVRVTSGTLQLRSGTALYVYNATNDGLGLWYNPGGAAVNQLVGRVNGADRLTIDGTAGNVTVGQGNLVIGTSGKGIDFSATSHPAGMTSELFADYEEGTWTPAVGNQTVVGTFSSNGAYTKIGRQVFFRGQVIGSTSIAGAAGSYIGGLPYTSTASGTGSGTIANLTAGAIVFIGPSDTNVYIVAGYAATGNFEFSGMYFA
jgi:hypothetical protein